MGRMALKVGGNELDDPQFIAGLIQAIAAMPERPILVHGGGKEISQLAQDLGLTATFLAGQRVTDAAMLRLAVMVLCGLANKRLVATLLAAGIPALGVSGVDLGLFQVVKWPHPEGDLGYVGKITTVNAEALDQLLALNVTLVVSPISADSQGQLYNVNADHAAQAVARSLQAGQLVFVTNVPGVMQDGVVIPHLTRSQAEAMIEQGVIFGGMIPKVRSALEALADGVATARICNLSTLAIGGTAITN